VKRVKTLLATGAISVLSSTANGEIISYSNNFAGWQTAAGPYQTCTFAEFEPGTIITDQYARLGAYFTNIWSDVVEYSLFSFPSDGVGIDGNGPIEITFSETMYAAALHGKGIPTLKLYKGSTFLGDVQAAAGTPSNLVAAVSTIGFDRVVFQGQTAGGDATADTIYFSTVPGPGALAALGVLGVLRSRRRSR
jgi:MYXO-CTERM domain-containing protein